MKSQLKVVLLLLAALVLTACNKKVKEEVAVDPNAGSRPANPACRSGHRHCPSRARSPRPIWTAIPA